MNRNDLRRVDMNLLVIFEALMLEPNLTRVGEKLFLSTRSCPANAEPAQPARRRPRASRAVSRLTPAMATKAAW